MREEPLLTVAPAAIKSLPELYAVALHQAQRAVRHYGTPMRNPDKNADLLRPVFDSLAVREQARADALKVTCVEACGSPPGSQHPPTAFIDLVPAQEVADTSRSDLATPYTVWALAVRQRQRAFIYWTYVAALAEDPAVRNAAERLAREALFDGNELRRERRLAWQSEHRHAASEQQGDRDASAALLESLLRRDVIAWSSTLPPAERTHLLQVGALAHAAYDPDPAEDIPIPSPDDIAGVRERALRRAEQLSNIYLDEADKAIDQGSLELAQKFAAQSIVRLAELRAAADVPALRQP
jgi:hypothetical protein